MACSSVADRGVDRGWRDVAGELAVRADVGAGGADFVVAWDN